jgi:hypothetical protein
MFDDKTGALIDHGGFGSEHTTWTLRASGDISGAKPFPAKKCVPIMNTPVNPLTSFQQNTMNVPTQYGYDFAVNTAFRYFINLKDLYNYIDPSTNSVPIWYKGVYDKFREGTVMSGGISACLNTMRLKPYLNSLQKKSNNFVDIVEFRRAQAYNCAAQYIFARALRPWYVYEPAGSPLALLAHPVVVPQFYCQPLVAGDEAKEVEEGALEEYRAGMARVISSAHPLYNENEYLASTMVDRARRSIYNEIEIAGGVGKGTYDSNYIRPNLPDFELTNLPCVVRDDRLPPPFPTLPPPPGPEPDNTPPPIPESPPPTEPPAPEGGDDPKNYCPAPEGESPPTPENSPEGSSPMPQGNSPDPEECRIPNFEENPLPYTNAGISDKYYCPNVEAIKDPTNPFSPRQYIVDVSGKLLSSDELQSYQIIGTDREWSNLTSRRQAVTCRGNTIYEGWMYTNYNDPDGPYGQDPRLKISQPTVQCGIVPVDILDFRYAAFRQCMGQRIAKNQTAWYAHVLQSGSPAGFVPPCSTKYTEDDKGACPTQLNVQECCSIITKPLVPMNQLKLRTCQGVLDDDQLNQAKPILERFGTTQSTGPEPEQPLTAYVEPFASKVFNTALTEYDTHLTDVKQLYNIRKCDDAEPPEYRFEYWYRTYVDPMDSGVCKDKFGRTDRDKRGSCVGVHMPYMRYWDTGAMAGMPRKYGSFVNTLGGYDVIVGAGREGRTEWQKDLAVKRAEDLGKDQEVIDWLKEKQTREAGNLGGWGELMLQQMYTTRFHNLSCLGRYEKLFKDGGADNFMHYAAGGSYVSRKDQEWQWPLSWRGYAMDETPEHRGLPSTRVNLDQVQVGDIAIFRFDGVRTPMFVESVGFPFPFEQAIKNMTAAHKLYYNNVAGQWEIRAGSNVVAFAKPDKVLVRAPNEGKFPSSTGVTMQWGTGPTRVIYRNRVPDSYLLTNARGGDPRTVRPDYLAAKVPLLNSSGDVVAWQPSCTDPDYTICVLPRDVVDWQQVEIFRPVDQRIGRSIGYPLEGSPKLSTQVPTNFFSKQVADGNDPPFAWRSGNGSEMQRGPLSGNVSRTFYCGPNWNSCTALSVPGLTPVPTPTPR